ncbi:uncharacterized protein METZ01_LOCUS410392, partial [marine metagenome]
MTARQLVICTLFLVSLGLRSEGYAQSGSVVFVRATVLDPSSAETIDNATVVVRHGEIVSIEVGGKAPDDARIMDLGGRFLVPGLIDAHVHISNLSDARRALLSGVTTARSMGGSFFTDLGLRELFARGAFAGPELLAAGYHIRPRPAEGLFLDEPGLADLLETDIRGPTMLRRFARAMLDRNVDFIKVNATERAGLPETDPRKPFFTETE